MKGKKKSRRSKAGYRSRFEERVANNLEKMGVAFSYETEKLTYTVFRTYKPDFILPNGVIVEAKGYFNKNSKTTYADWCDKKGFQWCERVIPLTWVS